MTREKGPMFLERRTYRRRRMADAARMLPLLGAFLFCVPLLWQGGETATSTTGAMFYLFGVWVLLVVLSGVISRHLRQGEDGQDHDGDR